ncbi:MAG: multidrug efflux RND transporter permease subunit [Lysobacterales bacterium]
MPSFFIDHPVFAWVIAILISLAGVISIFRLGVESYPNVVPPQVNVSASYPGASAETTEKAVTQVIEQQLTGIDHLLYFSSSSSSSGRSSITLTFDTGTNPDIAQVQVQNKVALATPRLPSEVVQQGVVVAKANAGFLMVVALRSSNPGINRNALNDIVGSRILDQISRVPGVGSTQQFGSEYAMNIWLDPDKLHGYGLSATQVLAAVSAQNVQFAAGAIGAEPAVPGQGYTATVSAEGRFSTPEQFDNVILRANPDGTTVRLSDVARVSVGAFSYGFDTQWNGKPTGAFAIQLLPGANALDVAKRVRAKMDELAPTFPPGVEWLVPYDSTTFVKVSIEEVVKTLVEAIVLVFLVMLVFLQNLRATIIPTMVIPVALLGTFTGMLIIGFTINQLTLFAMVLAIGILVDDAIVVIENVERIMTEEGLEVRAATRKALSQITGAVVAITTVLAAVFIPSALQSGTAGAIYKQFALSIAMAMGLSAFLALGFTPALCATMLKPTRHDTHNFLFRWFNRAFEATRTTYLGHIRSAIRHAPRWMAVYVLIVAVLVFFYVRLPGSFLPEEDQGYALAIVQLPAGATLQRTNAVMKQVREKLMQDPDTANMMAVSGFSFVGAGENVGMAFIQLKPWSERRDDATEYIARNNRNLYSIRDAQIFLVNLPTVSGLSQFGGFDMYLQDRTGQGRDALAKARDALLAAAAKDQALTAVRQNTLADAPQVQLDVDRKQAESMGLSVSDVFNAIQLMLAPVYVDDWFDQGRVKRVTMRADARFRMGTEALSRFFTPSSTQQQANGLPAMIPIDTVVHSHWFTGPPTLTRYNGYSAIEIVGSQAAGHSSGEAMNALSGIVDKDLPKGFGYDWTGQSYQEVLSGNTGPLLMALSVIVVFLALAALYESWSVPVAVMLVVPLGVLGAVVAATARGLPDDIFFKVGLITIIGLAAKNAILIVEFVVDAQKAGHSLRDSIMEAVRMRFRPILMTSFAFILGVTPLALSTGAGANARHAIGTGVAGGMLFATVLGLLLIPIFYVVVRRLLGEHLEPESETPATPTGMAPFDSDPRRGT